MGWHWTEVGSYFILTVFIILLALVTIGFHHAPLLNEWLPESCVLIILGVGVGYLLSLAGWLPEDKIATNSTNCTIAEDPREVKHTFPSFTPQLFFFVLLPPVILESAYSLYDVDFASNLGTVLLYAVLGTLMNTFSIGPLLYSLYYLGLMGSSNLMSSIPSYKLGMVDSLVFSSLISAVDPVAVLAIFQETRIDRSLYFLVFGESLLNDAVTVGLYHSMLEIAHEMKDHNTTPGAGQILLAGLQLALVGLVGLFFGVLFGLLTALLTKTTAHVRVLEPLLLLGLAYMSYVTAELFGFSGIIGIIGCGLVQARYAMKNISHKSKTTVKYFTKMQSAISEAIIFLFLGMALVKGQDREFHIGFVGWTLILCLICRMFGVFLLSAIANKYRVRHISCEEQFIMAYGGLRGAVCFSLVHMLDNTIVRAKNLFQTTSLVVILFTVFIQGTTIKPLMKFFHIKRRAENEGHGLMLVDIHDNVGTMMLAGLEQVTGVKGHFSLLNKVRGWDEKYLQKWFLSPNSEPSVLRAFRRHAISQLYDTPGGTLRRDDSTRTGVEMRDKKLMTSKSQDKIELRKILGTSTRPMSLMRHHIEDEDDLEIPTVVEDFTTARQRRQSQLVNARRLQVALQRQTSRNTQFFDNNTFNMTTTADQV